MPAPRRVALMVACTLLAGGLLGSAPATAADTISCSSSAPVLAVGSNGDLYSYPFLRASGATAAFGTRSVIGRGWQAYSKVIAGPSGWVYALKSDGLWLYHRSGTTWDVQRRHFTVLGAYAAASRTNRITADERGTIFVLDDAGAVRAYRFNADHSGFSASGDLVLPAVSSRNLLVATGDGVLVTRRSDGSLWRTRYEATSDRIIGTERRVGSGWGVFSGGIVSVGGDVLLGITGSGALKHYRYREDTGTWPVVAHTVGAGWGTMRTVSAQTNACRLTTSYIPPAVSVSSDDTAQPVASIVGDSSGTVDTVSTGTLGTLLWARYLRVGGGSQVAQLPSDGGVGTPAAAHLNDGRLVTLVTSTSGRMRGATQQTKAFGFGPSTDEGGLMASSPVAAQLGTRITYFAVDAAGALWAKTQDRATGELLPWRAMDVTGLAAVTPTVAGLVGDRLLVGFLASDGTVRLAWFDGTSLSGWTSGGGSGLSGRPAVALYPGSADAVVAARGAGGGLVARRVALAPSGASTEWAAIPGSDTTSGAPAIAITGKGTFAVLARPTTGGGIVASDETDVRSAAWKSPVWLATSPQGTPQTDPIVATGYSWSVGNSWFAISAGLTPGGHVRTMYDASGEVP
jgi:hypothetical protein